jgi:hypothetical protein
LKELQLEDDPTYKPKVIHGSAFKHLRKIAGEEIMPKKFSTIDFNVSPSKIANNAGTEQRSVSPELFNF